MARATKTGFTDIIYPRMGLDWGVGAGEIEPAYGIVARRIDPRTGNRGEWQQEMDWVDDEKAATGRFNELKDQMSSGDVYSVVMFRVDSVIVSDVNNLGNPTGIVRGRVIKARVIPQTRRTLGLAASQSHGVYDFRRSIERIVCKAKVEGRFFDWEPEPEDDDTGDEPEEGQTAA